MQAIIGDETGLIKLLDLSRNQYYTYGEQSRDLSIESLSWVEVAGDKGDADADADADDVEGSCTSGRVKAFAALRANGALEAWKLSSGALVKKCSKVQPELQGRHKSSRLVQLQRPDDPSVLLCVNHAGSVFMNKLVATPSSSWAWNTVATFQARGPISACATCCGSVAMGGKENDVSIYDLATHKGTTMLCMPPPAPAPVHSTVNALSIGRIQCTECLLPTLPTHLTLPSRCFPRNPLQPQ